MKVESCETTVTSLTVRVRFAASLGRATLLAEKRIPAPSHLHLAFALINVCPTKKRARENLEAARLSGTPVGELQARQRGGRGLRRTTPGLGPSAPEASQASPKLPPAQDEFEANSDDDEEEGTGRELVPMRGRGSQLSPVAACREHSTSVWLHFPHVELVVLFFAFEGAVASFASAMRHAECPEIFYTALAATVSVRVLSITPDWS